MTDQRGQRRADGLAVVVAIVLDELSRDGKVWPHTRELLASALAAYEAGKDDLGYAPRSRAVAVPLATTKKKPAASRSTKAPAPSAPKARNVITPDDIGGQGVFIRYDAHADRYYAAGLIGPLARCIGEPYVLKSDAVKQARGWLDRYGRTGYVPENRPHDWKPAPNQPPLKPKKKVATRKTKRLRRKP